MADANVTLERIEFHAASRAEAVFKIASTVGPDTDLSVYFDIPKGGGDVVALAFAQLRELTHAVHESAGGSALPTS